MPRPSCQLQIRRTVLVVVEGDTEFAFCRHLKAIGSHQRNLQVTIKNAHGGSPDKIINFARQHARQSAYDAIAVVFDADKPLTAQGEKAARAIRARLFRLDPCVEGFFLRLLKRPVPATSAACKHTFHHFGLNASEKLDHDAYSAVFPLSRIDEFLTDPNFAALWNLFTNNSP